MNKYLLFLTIWATLSIRPLQAQVYLEQKTQHRFAQTYVGFNTQITPSSGSLVWQDRTQAFPTSVIPRFTIGGLHFWGKLDFNMNLYMATLSNTQLENQGEVNLNSGGDLSARYYPWRMEFGKLRPYAGISLSSAVLSLGNDTQGKRYDAFVTTSPVAGLSFALNNWQINAEAVFLPQHRRDFYSSESQKHTFELPRTYLSLGLIRYFDTTIKEEAPKATGKTEAVTQQLAAQGKLNSFSIGLAPSGAYFFKSPLFSEDLESLPLHKSSFNLDIGIGYLFHQAKWHLGFSYRAYDSRSVSYSLEHIAKRQSIAFEAYKFLLDYNGFVPFVGASISAEKWATGLFRNDVQQGKTVRTSMVSPGIIFGWDISPTPLDTWVLRTNLRYYPYQEINDIRGQKSRVDQFEFNFIQLVIYPNRMFNFREAKRGFY
jgi:hypothetical protein